MTTFLGVFVLGSHYLRKNPVLKKKKYFKIETHFTESQFLYIVYLVIKPHPVIKGSFVICPHHIIFHIIYHIKNQIMYIYIYIIFFICYRIPGNCIQNTNHLFGCMHLQQTSNCKKTSFVHTVHMYMGVSKNRGTPKTPQNDHF